ncbi:MULTISPECIES: transcriptional repressor [Methylomonas]|nr:MULTISPECIES: transcriptional repressor [Methylomonas]TCV87704.1 Fur family zinc uptake transcriptional regulator [Methylomonas methanica]
MTDKAIFPAPEHDHSVCINKAISVAEQLCLTRGVQLTPIRHKILELIWNSHKAVKAYDLLDQIRPVNDAAKPSTVYRALDFLLEQGLIHRVESLNAFVGCHCSGTQHDQLLLICTECHTVQERSAPLVLSALSKELGDAGFVPQRKTIEIHGLCKSCRSAINALEENAIQ